MSIARPPIPVLTGVRGVAALAVTIAHYCNSLQLAPNIVGAGAGQLGVMLFFALSGFLMGYLYCDWPSGTVRIEDFAVARLARVGPLFVLVVMLSWICATYLPSPWDRFLYPLEGTASLASHLLLLDGVDVLWTIPVEIHFYLIFALGLAASGRVPGAVFVGALALALACLRLRGAEFVTSIAGMRIDIAVTKGIPLFLAGVLVARLRNAAPNLGSSLSSRWWSASLAGIVVLMPATFERLFGIASDLWASYAVMASVVAMFACIVFLVPPNASYLASAPMRFAGDISYSLYLLHMPVLRLTEPMGTGTSPARLVSFVALSLTVAAVSCYCFEKPCRRAIRRGLSSDPVQPAIG